MKLRKTESVGILDNKGIGIRHVYPCFYYSGTNQNVNFSFDKFSPNLAQFLLAHLSVGDTDVAIGDALL